VTDLGSSDLEALRAEIDRLRHRTAELEAQSASLARLLFDMPKLFASHDPDALVAACAEAARSTTSAAFALFVSATDHVQTLVGADWSDFADAPSPGLAPMHGGDGRARTRRIDDVTRLPSTDAGSLLYAVMNDGRLVRGWLMTPVRDRQDELSGVLYLGHPRPQAFTAHHEQQVALLASSLGMALDAAVLASERERVVSALESSLLPPLLPPIANVDAAARYRPADDAARVGGDFYDLFRSGDNRWSVIIGDVCGAGPEAAAITGVARYTIRALTPELTPAAALERLNVAIEQYTDGRFLSAVLGDVIVGEDGDVAVMLANGGHPPPVLLRDDGTTSLLERPHGALLGIFHRVGAGDMVVHLDPGDALILYTDGVIEARDKGGSLLGLERLCELVSTSSGRSAEGIARRIELAAVAHASGTVDDIAVLVLRRRPARTP
jgi:serine phosphatase RsbU (regulator of sigma subunit)